MVANSDLPRWQNSVNGINESGKTELTKEEWSALTVLNGNLSCGGCSSDESRYSYQLLKDNLSRHSNHPVLQMHLQNFIALCEKYFKTQVATPTGGSGVRQTSTGGKPKKSNGVLQTMIVIGVVLAIAYFMVKDSEWFNNLFPREQNVNDNFTLEVQIPNGSQYSTKIDSVDMIGLSNKVSYNNGNFTLKLKDIKDISEGEKLGTLFYSTPVIISDPNARWYIVEGQGRIINAYKNGESVGTIFLAKSDDMGGYSCIMYPMYVDRECQVSGQASSSIPDDSITSSPGGPTPAPSTPSTPSTSSFNLALKKGWNKIYIRITGDNKIEMTTTPPSGLEWRVEGYDE